METGILCSHLGFALGTGRNRDVGIYRQAAADAVFSSCVFKMIFALSQGLFTLSNFKISVKSFLLGSCCVFGPLSPNAASRFFLALDMIKSSLEKRKVM